VGMGKSPSDLASAVQDARHKKETKHDFYLHSGGSPPKKHKISIYPRSLQARFKE